MATIKNKVIWQEGLFVQPQHFQQQQRYNDYILRNRLNAQSDFFWGFTRLSLNIDLLSGVKFILIMLKAVCRTARFSAFPIRIYCQSH